MSRPTEFPEEGCLREAAREAGCVPCQCRPGSAPETERTAARRRAEARAAELAERRAARVPLHEVQSKHKHAFEYQTRAFFPDETTSDE